MNDVDVFIRWLSHEYVSSWENIWWNFWHLFILRWLVHFQYDLILRFWDMLWYSSFWFDLHNIHDQVFFHPLHFELKFLLLLRLDQHLLSHFLISSILFGSFDSIFNNMGKHEVLGFKSWKLLVEVCIEWSLRVCCSKDYFISLLLLVFCSFRSFDRFWRIKSDWWYVTKFV